MHMNKPQTTTVGASRVEEDFTVAVNAAAGNVSLVFCKDDRGLGMRFCDQSILNDNPFEFVGSSWFGRD